MVKLIEIKETLDLCDIWRIRRIRNPKSKHLTFHRNHVLVIFKVIYIYIYILYIYIYINTVIRADVLAAFCIDHCPIIFTFEFESNNERGEGLWKFNKFVLSSDEYINKLSILDKNSIRDDQIRWEYRKFEIRQFSITFSKNSSKFFNAER